MIRSTRRGVRRSTAATVSAALVGGMTAAVVAASPASAVEVPVTGSFNYRCDAIAGATVFTPGIDLGNYRVGLDVETTAEAPLIPGQTQPAHGVTITLNMPEALQQSARQLLRARVAEGGSPDSSVNVFIPSAIPTFAPGVTRRIPLQNLVAAPQDIPPLGTPWSVVSEGTVPAVTTPGFAGSQAADPATAPKAEFSMPDGFTVNSVLTRADDTTVTVDLLCTIGGATDSALGDPNPVLGPYVTDAVDITDGATTLDTPVQLQLVPFSFPTPTAPPTLSDPANGSVQFVNTTGGVLYTPDEGFVGTDTFQYTASGPDRTDEGLVVVRVGNAPSKVALAPVAESTPAGKPLAVDVTVTSPTESAPLQGRVVFNVANTIVGRGTVDASGTARLALNTTKLGVGRTLVRATYAGNPRTALSRKFVRVTVTKRAARVTIAVRPANIRAGVTEANVIVGVDAKAGGVKAFFGGKAVSTGKVGADGTATLTLPTFAKPGEKLVKIVYAGTANVKKATRFVKLTVK